MKLKGSVARRGVYAFLILAMIAGIAVVIMIVGYATTPVPDLKTAGAQVTQLITNVGGTAKICAEANAIFKQFGTSRERSLGSPQLKDYPAMAALTKSVGRSAVIHPDPPARITVRIGTHMNSYFIVIFNSNVPQMYIDSPHVLRVEDSCIIVQQ